MQPRNEIDTLVIEETDAHSNFMAKLTEGGCVFMSQSYAAICLAPTEARALRDWLHKAFADPGDQ